MTASIAPVPHFTSRTYSSHEQNNSLDHRSSRHIQLYGKTLSGIYSKRNSSIISDFTGRETSRPKLVIQIFLVNQLQIGPKPISHLSSFCKFLPFRKQQLLAKYPGSCCIYTKTLGNLAVPKGNGAIGIAKSSKIYNFGGLISLRPKCRSRPAMKE